MWNLNCTTNLTVVPLQRSSTENFIITVSYTFGVIGNMAALYILHKEKKAYKNSKHALMLRCLASSDLVGLLGMLVLMYAPANLDVHVKCVARVLWRGLGLISGCVALVMAIERWLALTNPLLYKKQVTYHAILKSILCCWAGAVLLTCMPLLGFGLYFDKKTCRCLRYRDAVDPVDVTYAYVVFIFGLLLCIGISWANLAVTRYLCRIREDFVGRRISRGHSRFVNKNSSVRVESVNASTPDEIAFARLMVALSISFLICWVPNLLAIPLAQFWPEGRSKRCLLMVDVLMAIHFTLDPYIYVLLHHYFPCLRITFDAVQKHCCWGSKSSSIMEDTSCV